MACEEGITTWLVMPPELRPGTGFFLPDPFRAALAGRLARLAEARAGNGARLGLDTGASGRTAPRTAAALHARGARHAVVAARPWDRAAACALADALEAAGIAAGEPEFFFPGAEDEALARVAARLDGIGAGRAPSRSRVPGGKPAFTASSRRTWMIFRQEPLPSFSGVPFLEEGDRLVRRGGGRVPGVPRDVGEIRLLDPGAIPPGGSLPGGRRCWAVSLPSREVLVKEGPDRWAERCAAALARAGRVSFRFVPRAPRTLPPRWGGSLDWAVPYGLDHARGRAFLLAFCSRCFPEHLPFLRVLAGFAEMGVDPLQEMYAERALPDRNPDLLEVILP